MKLVEWNASLDTGIHEIDTQHRRLVELLNDLYDAYINKHHDDIVAGAISELERYTDYHFTTEERLMQMYNFENTNKHIIEHRNFLSKVKSFKQTLNTATDNAIIKLINFLRDWLINHIQGSDREYIPTLRNNGVR